MRELPLVNGPIFNTGKNFTPENFPMAWDLTMQELQGGLGSSGAGSFDLALWGCGRVAGVDFFGSDTAQIALPGSPALALLLPAAVYYVADEDGDIHRFAPIERTILDIPALLTEQAGHLRAFEVEDGDGEWALEVFGWDDVPDPAKIAAGFPCVGVVSSDADAVTSVSKLGATVIWPQPLVQQLLTTLMAGAGGGGGGTGVSAATQLPISLVSTTDTKTYIDQENAAQNSEIAKLGAGSDIFPAPFDILANETALNRAGLGEVNPPSIERGEISVVGAWFGHGQNDGPDFTPDTNDPLELPWDGTEGVFRP